MTTYRPTTADIEAATQVFADITELSDSLAADEALDYRLAIEKVRKAGADTIRDLDTQLKRVLEGQVERHGRRYWIGRKKDRVRFDHGKIASTVIRLVQEPDDEGVEPTIYEAVRNAVHRMTRLYISDSTTAKVGEINALGLNTDRDMLGSVRTWEPGEKEVTFMDIPSQPNS